MKHIKFYNNFKLNSDIDREVDIWIQLSESLNESNHSILSDRIKSFLSEHLGGKNGEFLKKLFNKLIKNKTVLFIVIAALIFNFNISKPVIEDSLLSLSGMNKTEVKNIINKSVNLHRYEEKKDMKSYLNDISQRESTNNWKSISKLHYIGKYQFGKSALKDCGYNHITAEKFKKDPNIFPEEEHDSAMISLLKKNKSYLGDYINKYEGKTINGVTITESGLLAAAHLVGHNKVKKFLKSNGRIVPKDGNGVECTEYIQKFGGYKLGI